MDSIVRSMASKSFDEIVVINAIIQGYRPLIQRVVKDTISTSNQKVERMVKESLISPTSGTDRVTGAMKFLTNVELHATNGESISDELEWRGARYKILTVTPDIDYGFYRSIGTRLDGDGVG